MRRWGVIFGIVLATALVAAGKEVTVEELKTRLASASADDRPSLCVEIAERQLEAADKLYLQGDSEKAKAAVEDVASYSEQARDACARSHKRLKQTEIAVRKMAHRLRDIKHVVNFEDQASLDAAIYRLERVRTDLLGAMFGKDTK